MAAVFADKQLQSYFPDYYAKQRSPERDYFWGIIFGVKPNYGKALIMHAIEQRN